MGTQVLGRVGREPVLNYGADGGARLNFSLAEDRSYRDSQGRKVARTQWYSCTKWGKAAESLAKYINKGDQILLEGDVSASVYFDREGEAQPSLDLNVQKVNLLDNRSRSTSSSTSAREKDSEPAEKPKRASSRATPRKGKRQEEAQQELPETFDNDGFSDDDIPFV